jgi:hypothetical protein
MIIFIIICTATVNLTALVRPQLHFMYHHADSFVLSDPY